MTINNLNVLKEAGFSEKESAVYVALLQIGKGSVKEVAELSGVDRTTTYRILQTLLSSQLAQEYKEAKKTRWMALHPRHLVEYVQRKKMAVAEIFPELEALYNLNEEKPKLTYYEGSEGMASLFAMAITETKSRGELLSFSAPGAAMNYYSEKRFEQMAEFRVKKQIMSRIIMTSIDEVPDYREGEDWKNWRHIKLVDPSSFPFKATINIWNNKIALITRKSHPIGVVVDNKDITDTFRSIFELLWQNLS